MSAWAEMKLGDLCRIKHGYAFKGEFFDDQGEFLLLTPGNFGATGALIIRDGKDTYYNGEYPEEYLLNEGDLVIAMTDLKQDAPILGSTIRIPVSGYFLHNQRLGLVREISEAVDVDFLYYLLNDDTVRWWLRATATGSTVRHTAPERICQAKVKLPPLAEQETISDFLRHLDDLIESNRRRIEILEKTARLLFREWFVQFRFPGHENMELVDSEFGTIPSDWAVSCLGNEIMLKRNNINPQDFADEQFEHYSIPAFDADLRPSIDLGADIRSGKYLLTGQSILVSKLNPRIPRIWRSDATVGSRRSVASTEFLVLADPDRWPLAFVYGLVSSTEFTTLLASTAGGTSTSHQRVKPADVMAMAILCPPLELVKLYAEAVTPMLSLVDVLLRQVEVARETRNLLLPRLVSGELNISELDLELEIVGV